MENESNSFKIYLLLNIKFWFELSDFFCEDGSFHYQQFNKRFAPMLVTMASKIEMYSEMTQREK